MRQSVAVGIWATSTSSALISASSDCVTASVRGPVSAAAASSRARAWGKDGRRPPRPQAGRRDGGQQARVPAAGVGGRAFGGGAGRARRGVLGAGSGRGQGTLSSRPRWANLPAPASAPGGQSVVSAACHTAVTAAGCCSGAGRATAGVRWGRSAGVPPFSGCRRQAMTCRSQETAAGLTGPAAIWLSNADRATEGVQVDGEGVRRMLDRAAGAVGERPRAGRRGPAPSEAPGRQVRCAARRRLVWDCRPRRCWRRGGRR